MTTRSLLPALCLSALLVPVAIPAQQPQPTLQTLRAGFQNPPATARLRCYWWWLNGNTTEDTITYELTEMAHKGFGGVLLVDANGSSQLGNANVPPGPKFASPAWNKLFLHALKTAASLHLQVTLNITSGWNLGGPDVTPDQASKILTYTRQTVDEKGFNGPLPAPEIKNGFYRQIAVLAYPLAHGPDLAPDRTLRFKTASAELGMSMQNTDRLLNEPAPIPGEQDTLAANVIDLTTRVDPTGQIHFTPPTPGPWEILRIGYTDSGALVSTSSDTWQGLAIDYLDPHAFDTFWDHTLAPILELSRPYLKTTLVNLATDSWELGGTNWTPSFASEFQKRRGYDPTPYLPVIAGRIVTDRATSDRFLNDLRRTVADLITNHYDHFAARAKTYGLGIQCESGGPHVAPLDALETFRSAAAPQTEYWAPSKEHRTRDEDRYFTKEAASAGDIYGKPYAAQEGMTSIGPQWSESPANDLKPAFDQALTEGMNLLVWHEFTSSPASFGLPGNEYFAGTHMNPRITWWPQSTAFFLYINRADYLLRQGHSVDDVLYFYGDAVPNFVRLKKDDPAKVLPGYDYDVTDEDALLHTLTLSRGALTTPTGNTYRILTLPTTRRLNLPSLERIAAYVHQGGILAGLEPLAPTGLNTPAETARFKELTHALFADCSVSSKDGEKHYGTGRVFCTADTRTVLHTLNLQPDFEDTSSTLDYIHRRTPTTDIYFLRNPNPTPLDTTAKFRVTHRQANLWNPLDGSVTPASDVTSDATQTTLPIHLAPYGSFFVLFTPGTPVPTLTNPTTPSTKIDLPATHWTITYQPNRGAPTTPQPLTAFQSWSDSPDPAIRFFSGTATYRTTVNLPNPGPGSYLTLTDVHEICTVKINGHEAGTLWAHPYRLDITAALHPGQNTIELEVTNLWPNRIIGDAQPNTTKTYTQTNIRKYTAQSPLLPSGLTGPVTIETTP
jgi:hypothetical protein